MEVSGRVSSIEIAVDCLDFKRRRRRSRPPLKLPVLRDGGIQSFPTAPSPDTKLPLLRMGFQIDFW